MMRGQRRRREQRSQSSPSDRQTYSHLVILLLSDRSSATAIEFASAATLTSEQEQDRRPAHDGSFAGFPRRNRVLKANRDECAKDGNEQACSSDAGRRRKRCRAVCERGGSAAPRLYATHEMNMFVH